MVNYKSKYLKYKLKLQKLNGGSESSGSTTRIVFNYDFFTALSNRQVYSINDFLANVKADFFRFKDAHNREEINPNNPYVVFKNSIINGDIGTPGDRLELLGITDELLHNPNNINNIDLDKILKLYRAELRTGAPSEQELIFNQTPDEEYVPLGLRDDLENEEPMNLDFQGYRYDDDGIAYTYSEFVDYYGPQFGDQNWNEADVAEYGASEPGLSNQSGALPTSFEHSEPTSYEHIIAPGNTENALTRAIRLRDLADTNFEEQYNQNDDGLHNDELFGFMPDGSFNISAYYLINRNAWNDFTENRYNDFWDWR